MQAQKSLENAQAKLKSTKGNLQQANATSQQTESNRRQYDAALAAIAQSEAQVRNAQLQLSYTNIVAPTDGKVGNKTAEVGQRVQPGQTMLSIVQEQPWVVANFKETQLGKMQPGQNVEIKIDAFPGRTFTGKVNSVAPPLAQSSHCCHPITPQATSPRLCSGFRSKLCLIQKVFEAMSPALPQVCR